MHCAHRCRMPPWTNNILTYYIGPCTCRRIEIERSQKHNNKDLQRLRKPQKSFSLHTLDYINNLFPQILVYYSELYIVRYDRGGCWVDLIAVAKHVPTVLEAITVIFLTNRLSWVIPTCRLLLLHHQGRMHHSVSSADPVWKLTYLP
jgi:hypothetical protein